MTENPPADYLAGLPGARRAELERVNAGGMAALREYLAAGTAVAFLGAGLEVVQEGPAGDGYGQFLDGTLREVLAGACQQRQGSLILLTSRFPFADLETFDGGSARMLDVPPFTPAEGAALLAAAGGDEAEGVDRGWAGKARALHARLVPPGLDPDPLGTVERLVAEQEAAAGGDESDDGTDA